MVQHVHQHGLKPTARAFTNSALTARKWWRRCQQQGLAGL